MLRRALYLSVLALLGATAQGAAGAPPAAALAADDVCGVGGGRACALNALQQMPGLAMVSVQAEGAEPAVAEDLDFADAKALFDDIAAAGDDAVDDGSAAATLRAEMAQLAMDDPTGASEWWTITAGAKKSFPWFVLNKLMGPPRYLKSQEYWWVPKDGKWFPDGNTTTMVRLSTKPASPGTNEEMAEELASFAWHDKEGEGWCYQRKPGAEPATLGWLMNVFLSQHQPTGSVPDLTETVFEKGKTCAEAGYPGKPGPDTAFDKIGAVINHKSATGKAFGKAFIGCAICSVRYIAYWRSTGLANQ